MDATPPSAEWGDDSRSTLDEAASKRLLAAYGVPVVSERAAADAAGAVHAAEETGFPVVLKALGSRLTHKSDRGLVRLALRSAAEVRAAAAEITAAAGSDLEGLLVQPMLAGRRELVAGLLRDPQFGPVVMLGLGGVLTEALADTTFRLAPLTDAEAEDMLGSLRSSRLLGAFRGEAAADRAALVAALTGLSRLAEEHPEVAEVDVNPLLITPEGKVVAVDALVVQDDIPPPQATREPVAPAAVGALFYPRSVAIVGASAEFGKWGNLMLTSVLAGGFRGQVHLVNPRGGEIAGRPVHRTVAEIPGPVDLAVITVPARHVLPLLGELADKGISRAVLVTSGFAEVGAAGRELERELVAEARRLGILVLGPNTMGICNPHHAFYCTGVISRPEPGPTAFVSQSGNMGVQLLGFAEEQGIGIRAFAGTGNEAMITMEDALESFAVDELTRTVLLYVEGVKDGRRFFSAARALSALKPIVLLKGGRSTMGRAAAASHTGALASDDRVFDAACRQAGVVLADRPMDMLDLTAAFSSLPLPAGSRVAVMTLGGGWGVVTADLCAAYGLRLPELPPEILDTIGALLPDFWSRANPVDLVGDTHPDVPFKVMEALVAWDGCDAVIHLGVLGRKHLVERMRTAGLAADPDADPELLGSLAALASDLEEQYLAHVVRLADRHRKPVLGVALTKGPEDRTVVDVPGCAAKGVVFAAPEQAVKSLARMVSYRRWLDRSGRS